MSDAAALDQFTLQLPADVYYHLVHTLCLALPQPPAKPGVSDTLEDLVRRDHAAIAGIAALAPAGAAEAELAAQFVAASEEWKDCLRLAKAPGTAPELAGKCRAQGFGMMRQANAALRLLLRLQARRDKLQTDHAARDRVAWIEHCALGLMTEALAARPQPEPVPEPGKSAATSPPAPGELTGEGEGEGEGENRGSPMPAPRRFAPRSDPDLIAAAERYAVQYPERAAAMRRSRRLPSDVRYFDPPEAALAPALIHADTPALAALDGPGAA